MSVKNRGSLAVVFVAVIVLGAATAYFVLRHDHQLVGLPKVSPSESEAIDREQQVVQRSNDLEQTDARHAEMHDPALKSMLMKVAQSEVSSVFSPRYETVSAWRSGWGLPAAAATEVLTKQGNVQYSAERFAQVVLDWDNSQFMQIRKNGVLTGFPLRGYYMTAIDITMDNLHRKSGSVTIREDADVIAVKVPAQFPFSYAQPRAGFLRLLLTNDTPDASWKVFQVGWGAPEGSEVSKDLVYYRPALR